MNELTSLVAANVTLVGTHFAMSHPLRAPLVRTLGEKGFLGLYSLVSLAALAWIDIAFRAVGPGGAGLWNGAGDTSWIVASLLTIVALTLMLGALKGNPAAPDTPIETVRAASATGVYAVTRHPMMWAFAIWALSHILIMPTPRTLVTAGATAFLALVGAHLQDRKKEALLGDAWAGWEAQTSYWPKLARLSAIPLKGWLTAVIIWAGLTWLHQWLGTAPAGMWRWLG